MKPKRTFRSFIKNVKERKDRSVLYAKIVPLFYKERKRTLRSFEKNGCSTLDRRSCDNEDLLEDYAETVCVVIILPLPTTRHKIENDKTDTFVKICGYEKPWLGYTYNDNGYK